MKKSTVLFILMLNFFFLNNAVAQDRAKDIPLKISDEERMAITRLLKTVDAKRVSVRFDDSRVVYGTATISASRMASIKKIGGPGDKGIIVNWKDATAIYLKDGTTIYVAAASGRTGQNSLLTVLGKTKTAQLKAILAKYLGAPDTLDAINVKTTDEADI
jgi:hypothetical protein